VATPPSRRLASVLLTLAIMVCSLVLHELDPVFPKVIATQYFAKPRRQGSKSRMVTAIQPRAAQHAAGVKLTLGLQCAIVCKRVNVKILTYTVLEILMIFTTVHGISREVTSYKLFFCLFIALTPQT
jgi:hypothetical protein